MTWVDTERQIDLYHFSFINCLRIFLSFSDEVSMIIDIGVDIRLTLGARNNPGSNTVLYAVADERATAVTLKMQTNVNFLFSY